MGNQNEEQAGAKKLALVHYAPDFTDAKIDGIQKKARAVFPHTFAAADHMKVRL